MNSSAASRRDLSEATPTSPVATPLLSKLAVNPDIDEVFTRHAAYLREIVGVHDVILEPFSRFPVIPGPAHTPSILSRAEIAPASRD